MDDARGFYRRVYDDPHCDNWTLAQLGRGDRFFLLVCLMHRTDLINEWLFQRVRELEAAPDSHLDLWAREHYKSTIGCVAGAIQEIINDPEITICILSNTTMSAVKNLMAIKSVLENNETLKTLYPEILYQNPDKEAPQWSLKGLVVKRSGNMGEPSVAAYGLDSMPTGSHFKLRIYDDLVTEDSVTTPEQMEKTRDYYVLSDNLGARGDDGLMREQMFGTRYHFSDVYSWILDRKTLKPRIYPATDNGLPDGKPVLLTNEAWELKKAKTPSSILACQQLLNPAAGTEALFQLAWLKFQDIRPATLNVYIMVDPASSKKKGSDRTAMPVVGIDAGNNYWLLDGYHHKMGLTERWHNLKTLRRHWLNVPGVQSVKVGYERYGSTSDLEYFEEMMQRDRDAFDIAELAWPRDGPGSKFDRIQRLEPSFRAGRWYFPAEVGQETRAQRQMKAEGQAFRIFAPVKRRDENNNIYTVVGRLLEEYPIYPFSAHDDGLDALSRIGDMDASPPVIIDRQSLEPETFSDVC